jgi:cyclopropane-fatty-acyl-phospholipid synthase
MAYTFKCRSRASVTLLDANGDELLRLIGRSPATRGAIGTEALPLAIAALEAAIVPPVPGSLPRATAGNADRSAETEGDALEAVPLRQRALPFLELLRGALASGEPVTWGVV